MKIHSKPVIAALLLSGPAWAQTQLPDTTVTASRFEEAVESATRSVSVVTRTGIERSGARDISEVLRQFPGVQIGRNGGPGQATSIFLRGTASDQVLILIDGVPVQSGTTGATAIQHIDPASIERIEVVRGPASTLYGSGAIGGVIQIFTRKGHIKKSTTHAAIKAGNEASVEISAGISGGNGPLTADLDISHQKTDGYPPKSSSSLARGYRHDTFNATLGYEIHPDLRLGLAHWQSQGNVEYLDFFNAPVDQDVRNSISRLTLDAAHSDEWSSRVQLSRVVDNSDENQSSDFAHTERLGVDWQHTWLPNETHTLVGGITLTREKAQLLSFGTAYDKTSRIKELYLQDTLSLDDLRLQAGIRGIDHNVYGKYLTWTLGAGYQVNPGTHLYANAGSAFRSPSANDLYGFGGNPNFDPEKSRSFEIGVRQRLNREQSVSLAIFHTRIDDLIESDPNTFVIQQIEKARIRGIELGYDWHNGPWQSTLAYTWQDAENLDQSSSLARRAENKLNASIGYDQGRWSGKALLTAETERRDSRFNNAVLGAYHTFDLSAGYRLNSDWQAELNVTNLLDKNYQLAAGFPAQGRLVLLGLRYSPQ